MSENTGLCHVPYFILNFWKLYSLSVVFLVSFYFMSLAKKSGLMWLAALVWHFQFVACCLLILAMEERGVRNKMFLKWLFMVLVQQTHSF